MRVIVVEPHPDDAFLSAGWHLQKLFKDHERIIITVFCDMKRANESKRYAAAIGAQSITLNLPETGMSEKHSNKIVPELRQAMKELQCTSNDRIIFPVGLQHPDHYDVAATRPANCWRYLDTPYQSKLKLGDQVRDKTEGLTIASLSFPPSSKWKHIPIFKSQGTFFYFNKMEEFKGLPEILLR